MENSAISVKLKLSETRKIEMKILNSQTVTVFAIILCVVFSIGIAFKLGEIKGHIAGKLYSTNYYMSQLDTLLAARVALTIEHHDLTTKHSELQDTYFDHMNVHHPIEKP